MALSTSWDIRNCARVCMYCRAGGRVSGEDTIQISNPDINTSE